MTATTRLLFWRTRLLPVTLLASVLLCCSSSKWRRADEFVSRLRCGMSKQEVAALVAEFRGLSFREVQHAQPFDFVAQKGDTPEKEVPAVSGALEATRLTALSWS